MNHTPTHHHHHKQPPSASSGLANNPLLILSQLSHSASIPRTKVEQSNERHAILYPSIPQSPTQPGHPHGKKQNTTSQPTKTTPKNLNPPTQSSSLPLLPPSPSPFTKLAPFDPIFDPGCEFDTSLILVGGPGIVGSGVPSAATVEEGATEASLTEPAVVDEDEKDEGSSRARSSGFSASSRSNWARKKALYCIVS